MNKIKISFFCMFLLTRYASFAMLPLQNQTTNPDLRHNVVQITNSEMENITHLYDELPSHIQSLIGVRDFEFIVSDIRSLTPWQMREALIPLIDPNGSHKYLKCLKLIRSVSDIALHFVDLGIAVVPVLTASFPDFFSYRSATGMVAAIGIGKIVFSMLKKKMETSIKEESKKIFLNVFHREQPFPRERVIEMSQII